MSLETLRAESKEIVRDPIAKAVVTFTDPLIDLSLDTEQSENNRVSYPEQITDLVTEVPKKWFHTNDTDVILDGSWFPMASTLLEARRYQVGWWGTQSAGVSGEFLAPNKPTIASTFTARPVYSFVVAGDSALNEFPVDFKVTVFNKSGENYIPVEVFIVTGNTELKYSSDFNTPHFNAAKIELEITTWNTPGKIVKIVEFYTAVIETFYSDDIFYMNLLEEFEGTEGTLPVGNISCNEMDINFQNITDRFFSENTDSTIHRFIKRNRKIEPYFGFRYPNGTEEYVAKGLYWSGDWTAGDNDTGAQTTARDRFELLRRYDFPWETVFPDILQNVTLKSLTETVLNSVTAYMYDFFYDISDLDDFYFVPHFDPEFFKGKTYFDVIRDLATAGLSYAYMDLPTEDEIEDNGPLNKDMFRMKKLTTAFPITALPEDAIEITKRDFIEKVQPAVTESMANTINVIYKIFTLVPSEDPEEPAKWESEGFIETRQDDDSVVEYGVMNYEYKGSDLIQTAELAIAIANSLLVSFKIPKRDIELQAFGDITLKLADQTEIPEYQKNGIDKRGIFALTKLSTQFDGSLRMGISGRKLIDDEGQTIYKMLQDTDNSVEILQDTDGSTLKLQDTGA
jgi:hypothetical protein